MGWYDLASQLWDQSARLNAERGDHPLCGGAISRLGVRGETSCQYALYLLRWLGRAPEEFLVGPAVDVGDARLPEPGADSRLRWDLAQLHAALNGERQRQRLTWAELAEQIGRNASRLTNLRTARMADMALVMRVGLGIIALCPFYSFRVESEGLGGPGGVPGVVACGRL